MLENIDVIAFDADDTLWENETLFRETEAQWCRIMQEHGTPEEMSARLFEVEMDNMEDYGYGVKAFILSLIETAAKIAGSSLSCNQVTAIIDAGKSLLRNPAAPLPGVEETLTVLKGKYRLVLLTKGDLLDQRNKLCRSGLEKYFDIVEIVANKTPKEYNELFDKFGITPDNFVMVGNSFKSDIAPVLHLGGYGVHIPFKVTWEHEKTEEFDHPRLIRLTEISELTALL